MMLPYCRRVETLKKCRFTSSYCIITLLLFSHPLSARINNIETNKNAFSTPKMDIAQQSHVFQANFLERPSKSLIIAIDNPSKKIFSYHFKESSVDEKKIQINLQFKF